MNASAYPNSSAVEDYTGPPPVLIAASSEQARDRAARTIEAAGFRTWAVPIEEGVRRLDIQGAASALWVEVDRDLGEPLDRLLERVQAESGRGSFPAIVAAPAALIDPISARIDDPSIALLIDASLADRAAALAVATAWTGYKNSGVAEDISAEPSAARLRQLSDEVSRIAAAVPATTALRWIKTMTDAGLFKRRADPHDGRRVFVELAPPASEAMRRYFREVGKVAVV